MRACSNFLAMILLVMSFFLTLNMSRAANDSKLSSKTNLSKESVLLIARRTVIKSGLKIQNFKEPNIYFELIKGDKTWTVIFVMKALSVDGDIMVIVDDKTGESSIASR